MPAEIITGLHFRGNEVHPVVGTWLRQHEVGFEEFGIAPEISTPTRPRQKYQNRSSQRPTTEAANSAAIASTRMYCCQWRRGACMDWSAEYVLGNLKHDRFEDLCRSETFRRVLHGLRTPGDDLLCRTRHVAQSGAARDRLKGLKTAIRNIPGIGPVGIQTH